MTIPQIFRNPLPEERWLTLWTNVEPDNQFTSPKQCNYSSVLNKMLIANGGTAVNFHVRNPDLSYHNKFFQAATYYYQIDCDSQHIYVASGTSYIRRYNLMFGDTRVYSSVCGNGNIRMIDASSDPDYLYVTSNNATDGHGVRMIRKSDMTVVASLLATVS